jgi:hypothetical protein
VQPGRQDAGCNNSLSFAGQNSKLKIRMEADFQQRKGFALGFMSLGGNRVQLGKFTIL